MSIRENVNAAIKAAMINKEKATLQTLRMVSAAFKQIEVDQRVEITDEIALRELVRQVKQRQDAAQQFRTANRLDLAEHEEAEIAIIQQFLPQALSEDEIRAARTAQGGGFAGGADDAVEAGVFGQCGQAQGVARLGLVNRGLQIRARAHGDNGGLGGCRQPRHG